ncbi:MAG: leader peptide processing enzyme [Spirochaetaceae bacterium]|jgi:hypothetical protein|nr:leader peptide processing enzyme [Spirochaetaceae bacterium]
MSEKIINKKRNTIFFTAAASVFFILLSILIFAVFFAISIPVLRGSNEEAFLWVIPLLFVLSVFFSFLIYHKILSVIFKKIEIDQYFEPLFRRRK